MPGTRPTALMWSGGKDSALALEVLRTEAAYTVEALVTTVTAETETVTMHGVPLALVEMQARALGVSLYVMRVPPAASNATYEERLERALAPLFARNVTTVAAGDVLLEDVRAYREGVLRRVGAKALFPLWGDDPEQLARRVIDAGYRAIVTSIDTEQLSSDFVGRAYDEHFLRDLPAGVDPCGERGAFHTFVYDGPPFACALALATGPVRRKGSMRYVEMRGRSK